MGKKRHQKDRGYITSKEHKQDWGGYKDRSRGVPFQRLPFNCCAITFTPFEDPVCTEDGTVYDIVNVVPYVKKHGKHPVTGQPLALGDLIKLNYHRNADGEYACPVTSKVFTPHSHIVAVKATGNVYSYDAIDELCIKPKNWKDLLTDEPFTRKDIIHIQDPLNVSGRLDKPGSGLRNVNQDMQRALGALGTQAWYDQHHAKYQESIHTTGATARAFTSTVAVAATKSERQLKRVDRNPTKKGYLRLHTNLGDMNIELHCDLAPRTCENFIYLCEMGYYNDVIFHRSIKNFMIQGGDPTGTGMGGESIYGATFRDEIDGRLLHNGRGVLSMANSGAHTNGSQFFILYKSAPHLNFKHTVFGRVVGGLEVLSLIEKVVTDDEDRPLQEIKITGATIFSNPYQELEDEEREREEADARQAAGGSMADADIVRGSWFSNPGAGNTSDAARSGIWL
eukprot:gene1460-1802_t